MDVQETLSTRSRLTNRKFAFSDYGARRQIEFAHKKALTENAVRADFKP